MISTFIYLVVGCSLLLFQDNGLSSAVSRTWLLPDLTTIQAKLIGINKGEVDLEKDSGDIISIPFRELVSKDQTEVMRQTGWGRVWEDNTGEYFFIADLVSVKEDQIFLENIDGDVVSYEIARLSNSDKQYVESRRRIGETELPGQFTAKVVGVHDGDSITVLINNRTYKIRLEGIDAPETGQAFGRKSKQFLSGLIFSKSIVGTRTGGDKYGRNLCVITVDGINVNKALVAEGLAWHYKQFSSDPELASAEEAAKVEKKNIWSERGPVPPWEWRKWSGAQRKNFQELDPERVVSSQNAEGSSDSGNQTDALTYWLNSSSNIRHNSGCRWYQNSARGRPCTATEGKPCTQCGG